MNRPPIHPDPRGQVHDQRETPMNGASLSLDHRLREIHAAALDVRPPASASAGRVSAVSALRDRLGRALVGAGEALLGEGARPMRAV